MFPQYYEKLANNWTVKAALAVGVASGLWTDLSLFLARKSASLMLNSILNLCCSVCRFAVQVQTLAFAHPDKPTQRASIRLAGYALLIQIHTQSQSTPDAFTYTMFAHIVFR